jgi:hypothetical protein
VHSIDEMVRNIERHDDDDQYSNGEPEKYKKMIEDSKKPFYHGCAAQYMRLFAMVKLFQLKTSNGWSDCSFKDMLMLRCMPCSARSPLSDYPSTTPCTIKRIHPSPPL